MPSRSVEKSSDTGSIILSPGESSSTARETLPYEKSQSRHTAEETYEATTTEYPNKWAKYRMMIREPAAEFFGVAIMIIFGNGVDCQAVLSMNTKVASFPRGDFLALNFGWAVGVAMGVYVAGGISGAHLNPAITLSLATFRGFPWKKVPAYMLAQLLGALVGSALVYANYIHAIDLVEGGRHIRTISTASLFSTYALDYMTNVSAFFSEFLTSAILMFVILAMNDSANMPAPAGLAPVVLFMLILGIGAALGMETGYAINPARDLGPRLMTAMVGYGGQVFTFRSHYWLWCPIIAPFLGCPAGALLYDAFLFTGKESILNKPDKQARRRGLHARAEQRRGIPAGPGADEVA